MTNAASTDFKRGWLRYIYGKLTKEPSQCSLLDALNNLKAEGACVVRDGAVLVGSQSTDQGFSYAIPATDRHLTPKELFEVTSELIDRYDTALGELQTAGTASPKDSQIFAQMMTDLRAIKGFSDNWAFLQK